jgi:GDP-4-dehydro-6-deoxy-D-mannose reductase
MRVVVFGSGGFIGRAVAEEMTAAGHEVFGGNDGTPERVDLLSAEAISEYLREVKPSVIMNCAGVVSPEGDFDNNGRFTENIISGAILASISLRQVIITGSAGEYGQVTELPVKEETELLGDSPYALSKIHEENIALELSEKENIPVVVARVFNPVGRGMKGRFLVTNLLNQIENIKSGETDHLEVSRLDSVRDYVAVKDIATAYRYLAEGSPKHNVYNIGSGISTTNKDLVGLIVKYSQISRDVNIVETSPEPEPQVASQADISRITQDLNWQPTYKLEDTVKELVNET